MRRIKDNLQLSFTNDWLSIQHPDYPGLIVEINPSEEEKENNYELAKQRAINNWMNASLQPKNHYLQRHYGNISIRDDTYMNGSICRVDYTPGTKEGAEIALKVQNEFPDVYIHKNFGEHGEEYDMALFTQYKSDRYENEIFSLYQWDVIPDDLIEKYKLDDYYDEYDVFSSDPEKGLDHFNLQTEQVLPGEDGGFGKSLEIRERAIGYNNSWYGLKMDRTTKHIQLKVVVPFHQISQEIRDKLEESFPGYYLTNQFFATLHNEDGTVSPELDWYFTTNTASMMEWCELNDFVFPYPEEMIPELENKTMCFGIVYDKDEDKFKHVKAYIRNYI